MNSTSLQLYGAEMNYSSLGNKRRKVAKPHISKSRPKFKLVNGTLVAPVGQMVLGENMPVVEQPSKGETIIVASAPKMTAQQAYDLALARTGDKEFAQDCANVASLVR